MARNRKNQSAAIRFGPAIKALLLCLVIGGSGVGYVWQKNQIFELGKQIKQREIRLSELRDQNKKLRDQLAQLRSPAMLDERLRRMNLGLVLPQPNQILRLAEPAERTVADPRQFASSNVQYTDTPQP
ncbi:MAG TPA: septum formation initiator family protein [Verrucomicrobiota bacterium]|nr:septum formation initiator family protein [Verrucomicrobiota bacterium]